MRRLAALMLVVVLAGCGRSTSRPKEEDRVRIAVFEYQMDFYQAPVYFLSVGEATDDPNEVIMNHFENHVPPVKPASEGSPDSGGAIADMTTGETGVVIKAAAITWISEKECEVTGGYYAGPKEATGNTYRMFLRDGQWEVGQDTVDWDTQGSG